MASPSDAALPLSPLWRPARSMLAGPEQLLSEPCGAGCWVAGPRGCRELPRRLSSGGLGELRNSDCFHLAGREGHVGVACAHVLCVEEWHVPVCGGCTSVCVNRAEAWLGAFPCRCLALRLSPSDRQRRVGFPEGAFGALGETLWKEAQPLLPLGHLLPCCACGPARPPRGRLCVIWGRVGEEGQSTPM